MNPELLKVIGKLMKRLPEADRKEIQPELSKAIQAEKWNIEYLERRASEWD